MSQIKEHISSWGNYFNYQAQVQYLSDGDPFDFGDVNQITRGNGRSYGDCAIADKVVNTTRYDQILHFDKEKGLIKCQSGLLISNLLEVILPHNWFLYATPGTRWITIGGAVASDVHGKGHYIVGTFGDYVEEILLRLPTGKTFRCSKEVNADLFNATIGGMGLTGLILEVTFKLQSIPGTTVKREINKTKSLKETMMLLDSNEEDYSVAWIDTSAKDNKLGRGLVSFGHFVDGNTNNLNKGVKRLPFFMPSGFLGKTGVALMNSFNFHRYPNSQKDEVGLYDFFYPLDKYQDWNRLYGKKGMIQYQFVLPKEQAFSGIGEVLSMVKRSKHKSFISVLKKHGDQNKHILSFPIKGYSLALDFKYEDDLISFLNKLDKVVLKYSGRVYLAKDACLEPNTFKVMYPKYEAFDEVRKKYDIRIVSNMAKRLGIV